MSFYKLLILLSFSFSWAVISDPKKPTPEEIHSNITPEDIEACLTQLTGKFTENSQVRNVIRLPPLEWHLSGRIKALAAVPDSQEVWAALDSSKVLHLGPLGPREVHDIPQSEENSITHLAFLPTQFLLLTVEDTNDPAGEPTASFNAYMMHLREMQVAFGTVPFRKTLPAHLNPEDFTMHISSDERTTALLPHVHGGNELHLLLDDSDEMHTIALPSNSAHVPPKGSKVSGPGEVPSYQPRAIDFHPNAASPLVAVATWNMSVFSWGRNGQEKQIPQLKGSARYPDRAFSLKFSPDGNWLAMGSRLGYVHLWDFKGAGSSQFTPSVLEKHVQSKSKAPIEQIDFSRDGSQMLTLSRLASDPVLEHWKFDDPKTINKKSTVLEAKLPKSTRNLKFQWATFSPDGTAILALAPNQKALAIFSLDDPKNPRVEKLSDVVTAYSLSLNGEFLSVATKDGKVVSYHVPWLLPVPASSR